MDLTANGQVLTGTWTEETNPAGYYQGPSTTAQSASGMWPDGLWKVTRSLACRLPAPGARRSRLPALRATGHLVF
jgi:hypothetical protein